MTDSGESFGTVSNPIIRTRYDPPPIPVREFDWSATTDNYEPGHPIGWGSTEAEAIRDLKKLIDWGF